MDTKYDVKVSNEVIRNTLLKLTNQLYKLLPDREEGIDWVKPLQTIIVELVGMYGILYGVEDILFPLLCKLEGLFSLKEEEDFFNFRRTIFDCLTLMNELVEKCH